MAQYSPTFNPSEFELRNYTNPYLSPDQSVRVASTETRVNENLDFIAQMLGWGGPNYWSSLTSSVSQKRQLLGGSYGVFNSFLILQIDEIRNWSNQIVIFPEENLTPNKVAYDEKLLLGEDVYSIEQVYLEGDKYVISIGEIPQSFYDQIALNVPLKLACSTARPAPFRRPVVGASGDNSFHCSASGTLLTLYPIWDTAELFPYLFPILFSGSVYYFDQPAYLIYQGSALPDVLPEYDFDREQWYLAIPDQDINSDIGNECTLVWSYSNESSQVNSTLEVQIKSWSDPSDWGSLNVLNNFKGAWNNKGGFLPFNLAFDSLSIHGYDEKKSLYLAPIEIDLEFNQLINSVYAQTISFDEIPPGEPNRGDLWWSPVTGALSVWVPNDSQCGFWYEIDYRETPVNPQPEYIYPDVTSFAAGSSSLPVGTTVLILDITGLSIANNVIGVQGSLSSPGTLTLYRQDSSIYWTPVSFSYANVAEFTVDAELLPYKIPVLIQDSTGLQPSTNFFSISNLSVPLTGDYEVILTKYYTNTNWVLSPDSYIKFIANSSLFPAGSPQQGQMWWDFSNPDPNTRSAQIYYGSNWVAVNPHSASGPPAPTLDMSVILFYVDGYLLTDGSDYATNDYIISYFSDPISGIYTFKYIPKNLKGKTLLPKITVSDSLTTTFTADISDLVFGGINYKMSPNVYDSETLLRLWKPQDLQVAETIAHLQEDNFINPLLADLNNGPGADNWERYFIRLPLDYGRNENDWQKTALICQDFGYWGSSVTPEKMICPPEEAMPAIYEELFLYGEPIPDYTYVYCEAYLYSNLAFTNSFEVGDFENSGIFPSTDDKYDEFDESMLVTYEPLHNRQADVSSPVSEGYGNWLGDYVNINPCIPLTGFYATDLMSGGIEPVEAPVWDASIYKFPPTCDSDPESYTVDANHYKIGYAYFVADASAAEEGFFDPQQEASWRFPETQNKTLYLTPR